MVSTGNLYDAVARVGQALSSGARLKMLELLAQRERPVVELAGVAGLNVTTASAHLQGLRNAGLVTSRRDGRRIIYRLPGPTSPRSSPSCAPSPKPTGPTSAPSSRRRCPPTGSG